MLMITSGWEKMQPENIASHDQRLVSVISKEQVPSWQARNHNTVWITKLKINTIYVAISRYKSKDTYRVLI